MTHYTGDHTLRACPTCRGDLEVPSSNPSPHHCAYDHLHAQPPLSSGRGGAAENGGAREEMTRFSRFLNRWGVFG